MQKEDVWVLSCYPPPFFQNCYVFVKIQHQKALPCLAADSAKDPLLRNHSADVVLALDEHRFVDLENLAWASNLLSAVTGQVLRGCFSYVVVPINGGVLVLQTTSTIPCRTSLFTS